MSGAAAAEAAPEEKSVLVPGKSRLVGLDLLRFFAVLLVIGRHFPEVPPELDGWAWALAAAWQRGGGVGVDLFFVLSGFLVSGLLFTELQRFGRIAPWRFYVRRGWKIYPAFYVLIAATVAYTVATDTALSPGRLLSELFFLQSYRPGLWQHTWSLAVEEHFYLLLPPLLLLVFRKSGREPLPVSRLLLLFAAVATVFLALRVRTVPSETFLRYYLHYFPTHLRMDQLFFGVFLAYWYHFYHEHFIATFSRLRPWLVPVALLCALPWFVFRFEFTPLLPTFGITLLSFGACLLVAAVLVGKAPASLPVVAAAKLGAFSYSIYLWHMPVILVIVPALEHHSGIALSYFSRAGLFVALSFALGIVMAKLVELPFLRVRDRYFPSRS